MEAIIYNPYPEREHYRDKKPKSWEVKVATYHINRDFARNELLKISNGDKTFYRYVKGVSYTELEQNHIWIDYDSRVDLGVDFDTHIHMFKANVIEKFLIAPLKSPVPWERHSYLLTFFIAIISLILAVVGCLQFIMILF